MSANDNEASGEQHPEQSGHLIGVRLQPADLELLDLWMAANGEMSRPEAMRKILRLVAMRVPK
jgi:hypothetical protein